MRLRLALLILLLFLFPLFIVQASNINIDYDYCEIVELEGIYITCREEYLFNPYLWLDIYPGVNYVIIQRVATLHGFRIGIILNNASSSRFYIRLPRLENMRVKQL